MKIPVKVEVPCKLPPLPILPTVKSTQCNNDSKLICYSAVEASKLYLRIKRLQLWITEAKAACEEKP